MAVRRTAAALRTGSGHPTPAPISEEECRIRAVARKLNRIQDFVGRVWSDYRDAQKAITSAIAQDYVVTPEMMKRISLAQARATAFAFRFPEDRVLGTDLADLQERMKSCHDDLLSSLLNVTAGATDSGYLNSTCSFTRVESAAKLEAMATLVNEIKQILDR